MIGYAPGEVEADFRRLLERVHPEDRESVLRVHDDAWRSGGHYGVEFRVLPPGGEVRWILAEGHVDMGPRGLPLRSYGVMLDVTGRVRAEEAERERATRQERSRIARDLHDSVTQALFAANLKAEALDGEPGVSAEVEEALGEVRRLNRGALAQMRALLLELRGEPLHQVPIRQLLRNAAEATESRTRTRVELAAEGDGEPPPDVHVALYRIAQEALNNVARHARAEHAWVELAQEPGAVRLSVRDDGCGFEPGPSAPGHLGLRSMRERAAESGAELRLTSAPGAGTELVVEWPLAVDTLRP
jgi:signal transduction histidine kinase